MEILGEARFIFTSLKLKNGSKVSNDGISNITYRSNYAQHSPCPNRQIDDFYIP